MASPHDEAAARLSCGREYAAARLICAWEEAADAPQGDEGVNVRVPVTL